MKTLEEILAEFMVENGVDADVASSAAHKCAVATSAQAGLGALAGAGSGATLMSIGAITPPTEAAALSWTIIAGVAGAGFGAYHAVHSSPSCQEVRDAASRLVGAGN